MKVKYYTINVRDNSFNLVFMDGSRRVVSFDELQQLAN